MPITDPKNLRPAGQIVFHFLMLAYTLPIVYRYTKYIAS